jgi:hypothetical protein
MNEYDDDEKMEEFGYGTKCTENDRTTYTLFGVALSHQL